MSTAELKSNLHQLIERITDNSKLEAIYTLLAKQSETSNDWADEIPAVVRKDIELSMQQAKKGDISSHIEITNQLKKKYPHLNL
jgi:flagellar biosynthesis/type III secretory pathway ATPase